MTAVAYLLNVLATFGLMSSRVSGYTGLGGLLLALIYLLLFPTLAFFSWHLALYRALKLDSSLWFVAYFCGFGVQLLFYVFLGVGFFVGGGGGLLAMLSMFGEGKIVAGIVSAVCAAAMGLCAVLGVVQIKNVGRAFRQGGHSVERAGVEAGGAAAQNKSVQSAAKSAVIHSMV